MLVKWIFEQMCFMSRALPDIKERNTVRTMQRGQMLARSHDQNLSVISIQGKRRKTGNKAKSQSLLNRFHLLRLSFF